MLDLIAHGADGHGPVHLLLVSAAEIGFAWDREERGWIRAALLPLRMLAWAHSAFAERHLCSKLVLKSRNGRDSGALSSGCQRIFTTTSFHLRGRDNMLLRAILCVGVWNGFLLLKAEKEEVECQFCGGLDGDGHLFLGVYLSHHPSC